MHHASVHSGRLATDSQVFSTQIVQLIINYWEGETDGVEFLGGRCTESVSDVSFILQFVAYVAVSVVYSQLEPDVLLNVF